MRLLIVCAGVCATALGIVGSAQAADTLAWSFAYSSVGKSDYCGGAGPACPRNLTQLAIDGEYGLAMNATSAVSPIDYAGETGGTSFGLSFSSAGLGAPIDPFDPTSLRLPELQAYTEAELVLAPNSPLGFGWNSAVAQGVTGFKWEGVEGIDVPFDAFIAQVDYLASGAPGTGYIGAGLAITTDAIIGNDALGGLWYNYGTNQQFAATCDTGGAIGIGNPTTQFVSTPGTFTVTPTGCSGGPTFHLDPGEEFYLWAKLSLFQAVQGNVDASHTFSVAFNPFYADTPFQAQFLAGVEQLASADISTNVPEPATWAMMLLGLGAAGVMIRRRRIIPV